MAIIQVDGLVKRYGGRAVVDGIDFAVEQGEIFGILGPNGAGKTTTVECIVGLRTPDGGSIRVAGLDPGQGSTELRERMGVQLQEGGLPPKLRVGEALELYSSFYRRAVDWRELLAPMGLLPMIRTPYGKLSGGQKQRVSIALAMLGEPEVVVLDELTTGLDPHARRDVWDLIDVVRDRGATVLLVSHFMEEVERLCDRLAVIDDGRVVALDTPAGLIASVSEQTRVRLRSSAPFDVSVLESVPGVSTIERAGGQLLVTGTGDLLGPITDVLRRERVDVVEIRLEPMTLDDAFMAITGRRFPS